MNIRPACVADSPQLMALLHQLGYTALTEEELRKKVGSYLSQDNYIMVYEIEGKVVSFIALHIFPLFHSPGNAGRITAFCVDERHRSQGIGLKLLKEAEAFFVERGCTRIEVTSNNRRTVAHAFYLNHGYVEDSRKFVKYF
jgi:ribosomal protein S18 acetylase RimI-like enzyme